MIIGLLEYFELKLQLNKCVSDTFIPFPGFVLCFSDNTPAWDNFEVSVNHNSFSRGLSLALFGSSIYLYSLI